MFEITLNYFPATPSASVEIEYTRDFVNSSYEQLFAYIKDCVDKNLIINLVRCEPNMDTKILRYYSTTLENAQAFQQVAEDMNADFSLKKFWHDCGLTQTANITEIDFDSLPENELYTLIDVDTGELWAIPFPIDYRWLT
jgi:hypothetical protein